MSDARTELPTVAVSVSLAFPVTVAGTVAVSVALAEHMVAFETLAVTDGGGGTVAADVLALGSGTRMHLVDARSGNLTIHYDALSAPVRPDACPVTARDRLVYLRPSRYCPSDRLAGMAANEFGGIEATADRVQAITRWINYAVAYVPGASDAGDDAMHPLLTRQGVCRDFAHLGVTLCRAVGVPARYVSVYAPGLDPMDAHAVFEAEIDGSWRVFDATGLAPRTSLVRIATGRDAADAALVSPISAQLGVPELEVTVTAQPELPDDNWGELVTLA